MLKYTFSTREKIMLALLLIVAIGIAWWQLIYNPIQNQIAQVDQQIGTTQNDILLRQGTASSIKEMNENIEKYKEQGLTPVFLPEYDNTRQLMIYLNATLSATIEYSMNFDEPTDDEEDGTVHRLGGITFSVADYAAARSIIDQIANGPYYCSIDALSVNDRSASSATGGNTEIRLDVTYYETGKANSEAKEEGVQGNDLSGLTNWNEQ